MEKRMNWVKKMCLALVIILIGSVGAAFLQTDFGRVAVKDIYILTDHQQYTHALAFIPKTASAENKVPVVITSHGWLNTGEVQDAASIELSRRGIMVVAMDAYSHGLSSNIIGETRSKQANVDAMGMIALVEYVTSSVFDYIDTSRVGCMGHSMGGNNTWVTIRHYGRLYNEAIEAAMAPDSDGGATITEEEQAYANSVNKVAAGLPTGSKPTYNDGRWEEIHCNVGDLYGALEEGGYSASTGNARIIGDAVEGVEMINSGLPEDQWITSVEEGKFYGDKNTGTLRVIYQPKTTHPLIHFDPASTRDIIEFFTYCFGINTALSPSNQTFFIKECFNGLALVGLFMMLVPLAEMFLATPAFASLKAKGEVPAIPALTDPKRKKMFWIGIIIGGAVSFLTAVLTMPVYRAIFASVVAGEPGALFNASTMNCVMTWTAFNAIWGMFWFWFNYKKDKAAGIRNDEMIGWKLSAKEFWKTLGLAAAIIGCFYVIVWFCKWAFNTDFRLWTPAVKTFQVGKLIEFFCYWPVFFAFYLANSLAVNGAMRVDGMNEKKNLLICAFANIIGATLLWAIQYGSLIFTGVVVWQKEWIDVLVIAFCIWQLFLAPFLLRKFFKKTGKVWLGALVVSAVYVFMGIMHTCITSTLF